MPKEANKKQSKEKKHFMKDFKAELKRVIWPTPKQLVNNTLAVIVLVLIISTIVFVLDFTFEKMNTYGIEGIKAIVEMNKSSNDITNDTNVVDGNEISNSEVNDTNTTNNTTNTVNE